MPLAAALGTDNMECRINEVSTATLEQWEKMKNIGIQGAKVQAQDLVFFGVRDTELPEDQLMETNGIRNYMVHEIRYRGLETCLQECINQLSECDMLYISFDVDSLDCDLVSKGTGTPVSKGFDHHEVIDIINQLLATQKVVCLEVTEVNPLLDNKGNKMAETAFKVLNAVTKNIKVIDSVRIG